VTRYFTFPDRLPGAGGGSSGTPMPGVPLFGTRAAAAAYAPSSASSVIGILSEIGSGSGDALAVTTTSPVKGLGPDRARSFSNPANFTIGAGWEIKSNQATGTATVAAIDMPFAWFQVGTVWQITIEIADRIAGGVAVQLFGGTTVSSAAHTADGIYTDTLTAVAGNNTLRLVASSGTFTGRITRLELRQVLAMPDVATAAMTLGDGVTTATYLRVPPVIDPVTHCGARGDDDPDFMDGETIALQKAIDWAHAKGSPINLGARSYAVNGATNPAGLDSTNMKAALWVYPGVQLLGVKGRTWIRNHADQWYSVLQVRYGNDIVIDGVGIDGNVSNHVANTTDPDTSVRGSGLLVWNTGSDAPLERLVLKDLIIQNTSHYGIGGESTEMVGGYFNNLFFRNIGGDGIDLKNYQIYEKQLMIDGLFFADGCGHNEGASEDNQACIDIGGYMVAVNNVMIEGLDSYGASLGNCGIRFRPKDDPLGRIGSKRSSCTNARVNSTKLAGEGSGTAKRIIGLEIGDLDVYVDNVQVVGAYWGFRFKEGPSSVSKATLVGCRAVNCSGAATADTDGVGFIFDDEALQCTLVGCEAEGCNVGAFFDGGGGGGTDNDVDLLCKDCTKGVVITADLMRQSTWQLRFINCPTEVTAAPFVGGVPTFIAPTSVAVMRDRRAFLDMVTTADDAAWTGADAILGGIRAFSQDLSGPGTGVRAAAYAEMTNSAGSGGTRWRFETTSASAAVDSLILTSNSVAAQLPVTMPVYTVATLPAAAGLAGARSHVSDSNAALAAGHGNVVAAGGANFVPVYSDGTNWRIG